MSKGEDYAQINLLSDGELGDMLFAQAEGIWPKEILLFEGYFRRFKPDQQVKILEVAAGNGEISIRLAKQFSNAIVTGVDLEPKNVEAAKRRVNALQDSTVQTRLNFEIANMFDLKQFPDDSFDIVSCRSALHAIQDAPSAIAQLARVAKKNGGFLHLLNEDYGMMYSYPFDSQPLWLACQDFFKADNTNSLMGRASYPIVKKVVPNTKEILLTYVQIDTIRVPRHIVSKIFQTWRNGYSGVIAKASGHSIEVVTQWWNNLISCTESDDGYSCWQIVFCSVEL